MWTQEGAKLLVLTIAMPASATKSCDLPLLRPTLRRISFRARATRSTRFCPSPLSLLVVSLENVIAPRRISTCKLSYVDEGVADREIDFPADTPRRVVLSFSLSHSRPRPPHRHRASFVANFAENKPYLVTERRKGCHSPDGGRLRCRNLPTHARARAGVGPPGGWASIT